jgi:hypothetical protein
MASFYRIAVSALLILAMTIAFFAQSSEAVKGPKITNKVSNYYIDPTIVRVPDSNRATGLF